MFVDASAIIAIIAKEPEQPEFRDKVEGAARVLISSLAIYESVTGLTRITQRKFMESRRTLENFIAVTQARVVPIDLAVGDLALDAFERFGKGRHRAALNMGDCFSYACAKVHRVPLLCKSDDFIHTDIDLA
jgi:ribonuclease VapC